jgi:hypothetical protein
VALGEHEKKTITIYVNNRPVEIEHDDVSGAAIKAAAGVPADFTLFIERGGDLVAVSDDEQINVHPNERFRAVSGQDVS